MDILVGGLTQPTQFSINSIVYGTDYATWCIKAAEANLNWKNIFSIFSMNLWIAVVVIFIVITILMYIYTKFNGPKREFIYAALFMLKINIGFMAGNSPNKFMARIFFFVLLFYGMLLSNIFQSNAVSSITAQYRKRQISTIKEAIERNFDFGGSNYSYSLLQHRHDKVTICLFHLFSPNYFKICLFRCLRK